MEFRLLGWPEDGVVVRLDHREYAYAGKFVMSSTGKVVAIDGEDGDTDDSTDGRAGDGDTVDGTGDGSAEFRIPDDPKREYVEPAGAVAFNEDRSDAGALWLRYVTVRRERRGEGIGPRLCAFVVARAADRGYERVRIAVNNAYSYEALHKAGFAWTGRETGIAELVLERPARGSATVDPTTYCEGLATIGARDDVDDDERAFAERKRDRGPPPVDLR
ncbi:GNAT family N-acetyltransferase [Halobaculum gomorrense]|uniref:Acetyltransferase (GNAT) family protein n=1 Tax=Halobaculum gomorrense TaxID=43928 RepID=A0A1M5U3E5_9EURY|nr:GNAT family N-acetyltransferase [Halobaculum gomorrense]SHH57203.1 Acetyltransferase (GNAT) family protein [Halobaculum gomorrense]